MLVLTHRARVATKEGKKDLLELRKESVLVLVPSGEVNIVVNSTKRPKNAVNIYFMFYPQSQSWSDPGLVGRYLNYPEY